ncbi:MAG: hypothetical protein IJ587_00405 [Synergistaceae bacterium]|nr:hypothetical protein [Synergistaceae bacterium]
MKDTQNYVSINATKRKDRRKEIKTALEELFERSPEYETQGQIITDLKDMGIKATQATLSRALKDLEIERNAAGKWTKSEPAENLRQLEKTFEYCGGTFRFPKLYSKIDVVILRTKSDFNTVLAKQITEAFPKEVLCTICPDDKNVIIYYKLKEKESDDDESEKSEVKAKSKSIYKKSKMRVELVRLCKKYRKAKKKEEDLIE